MSDSTRGLQQSMVQQHAKRIALRLLAWHLPVGHFSRPMFSAIYGFHVATRACLGWLVRFVWCEPLFRSQCRSVGDRFRMEQLPYIVGHGRIDIGNDVELSGKPSFAFSKWYSDEPTLQIGNGSFLGHNCALTVAKEIQIGKHCLIAGGVRISDFDGHPTDASRRRAGEKADPATVHPVKLGDDVWIGSGAVILKGVQIGDRAIIGARAVVTRDVLCDTVVAGNPARVVKSLHD